MEQTKSRSAHTQREWLANRDWLWMGWTALLSVFLIAMAGSNLGNFPHISGDDAWIMSASHKLAAQGVFGSDMFQGYANADQRYFIALPVYHFLQAGVFSVFGTGVAQARAVTLVSGLVILWCTAWLARRWFGVAVAVVAVGLLVFWRTYLMSIASGLSFISVSRTGRYDATGVAFMLLTLVLVERLDSREDRRLAVFTGVSAGLATLTQFFGLFVVPLILAALLMQRGRNVLRQSTLRWLAAGWLLMVIPYVVYVAGYWGDFVVQSDLKTSRIEFHDPAFYIHNLIDEPDRYRHLFEYLSPALKGQYDSFDAPLSPFIFGIAAIAALVMLAIRGLKHRAQGDQMLALSIAVLGLSLSVLDGTNARLYAVILLPLICMAIALMLVITIRWALVQRSSILRLGVSLVIVVPVVGVAREGITAHRQDYEWSNQISDYDDIAEQIKTLLPDGAPVLGMERWWAGLYREHQYLSIAVVTHQWTSAGQQRGHQIDLMHLLMEHRIAAIVVDDHARGMIDNLPEPLRQQFDAVIRNQGEYMGTVTAHPYGEIDVYVLKKLGSDQRETRRTS